jgi:type IV pilus assembly protein PilN
MIRINLLGVARQKARKPITILDAAQRTSLVCGLVIVVAVVGIGAWYLSLASQASRLEDEIATAQKEAARLKVVLDEVKRAEDRRADLKQRVDIIGQLRESQAVPVQLLDHVSRSMPNMLWLTALDQKGDAVIIEGRTTTLISLADFVANLGTNALVRKPIDIVNSEVESSSQKGDDDVMKFSVKAPLTVKTPPAEQGSGGAPAAGRGAKSAAAPGARSSR